MIATATVNFDRFTRAINEWQEHFRRSNTATVRTQARLLFKRIIELTPPKSRTQGRKAVDAQIRQAVLPLRPADYNHTGRAGKRVRDLIRAKNYAALQAVFANGNWGRVSNMEVKPFTPSLHQSKRDRRGRVRTKTRVASPDADAIKLYSKETQEHVGQAKGGWVASYSALGGKGSQWFTRHRNSGSSVDATRSADPFFKGTNRSRWARGGDEDRIVSDAMESRATRIGMDIERSVKSASKKAGLA